MAAVEYDRSTGFNTPAVVLCGIAVVILLFAVALFLQGGFLAAQANDYQVKVYEAPGNEEARAAVAAQQAILDEKVHWKDEAAGTVVMPIEDAMQRVVAKAAD